MRKITYAEAIMEAMQEEFRQTLHFTWQFVLQNLGGHCLGNISGESIDHDFDWVHLISPKKKI